MSIEPKKINLRTYNKVWKIENRIYAIQNIVLPVPVSPREVLYFFVIAFIILIISNIVHPIKIIPSVLRFIMIPFGTSQFLLKIRRQNATQIFCILDQICIHKKPIYRAI